MTPTDKIKLTNMVDQGVNHTLAALNVTNPEEIMNHFERVSLSIVEGSSPEDSEELVKFFAVYLQKKADKLGVKRSYADEQK
jgi:hypothetical protein